MSKLSTELREGIGAVEVRVAGIADFDGQAALDAFLAGVHEHMVVRRAPRVDVDLKRLEFISAACVKCFLSWIARAQALHRPYRIRFRPNPTSPWQRRSLSALTSYAFEIVTVDW